MLTTNNSHRRKADSWWFRGIVASAILTVMGSALVSWRSLAVVENDLTHVASRIAVLEGQIDRIMWFFVGPNEDE